MGLLLSCFSVYQCLPMFVHLYVCLFPKKRNNAKSTYDVITQLCIHIKRDDMIMRANVRLRKIPERYQSFVVYLLSITQLLYFESWSLLVSFLGAITVVNINASLAYG